MPRPRKPGAPSPKRRSRNGCWPCKSRKVKCDEGRPSCENCSKLSVQCDYSIRLNWDGRRGKQPGSQVFQFQAESPPDRSAQALPRGRPQAAPDRSAGPSSKKPRLAADEAATPSSSLSAASSPMNPPRPASTGLSRRLSVNSLLLGPPGPLENIGPIIPSFPAGERTLSPIPAGSDGSCTCYGIDRGLIDLDVVRNDDFNALSGRSPDSIGEINHLLRELTTVGRPDAGDLATARRCNTQAFGADYYSSPVLVRIPRTLEPLPPKLLNNPMNLMYFHHFLYHTAKVLVPFDGPRSNPFRTILPRLAVKNDHLLSLMLAYSASHRAKVLSQPEPATRIALWVQDIFPALRSALNDSNQSISNTNVATAIMLASLEILSPTAFGYAIPWQRHLMLARDLITARPGGLRWSRSIGAGTAAAEHDEIQMCNFLWSWFAYLDVLGSLSGGGERRVSPAWILDYKVYAPEDDDEIDCIMGFSTGCVYILARIAELVRSRSDLPSDEVARRAHELEVDLARSVALPPRPCPHIAGTPDAATWTAAELTAVNRAYHAAGAVHLQRRVLRHPASHPLVRRPIAEIVDCIARVPRGAKAETSLLFPLFTVGVESDDLEHRRVVLDRLRGLQGTGMVQFRRARELMEKAWDTGQEWETLLTTEFIG